MAFNLKRMIKLEKLEQEMRSARDQFKTILDSIDYGITVQDNKERLIYTNEGALRLIHNRSVKALMKKSGEEVLKTFEIRDETGKPFDPRHMPGRLALKGKKNNQAILAYRFNSRGEQRWAIVKANPVFNQKRKVEFVVNTFQDITEIKLEKLRQDHFIAIVSHELKTPLTGIKALTQIIQRRLKQGKFQQTDGLLSKVDNRINELTRIIDDFLDDAKIRAGQLDLLPSFFNFDELIEEQINEVRSAIKTHKIILQGRAGKVLMADRGRISQVISNLLRNAIKYSPDAKIIKVGVNFKNKNFILSVQDFGIGIPKDNLNQVFEPFFRVKNNKTKNIKGLGLGLYISYQIIKLHGGRMWVKSKLGMGSIFYFSLPWKIRRQKSLTLNP